MRNDSHRPTELDPSEYTWVGYTDDGGDEGRLADGPMFSHYDEQRGFTGLRNFEVIPRETPVNQIHPGGCDVCGQQGLRYRHYYQHTSGEVIVLGDQCVERMAFDSAEAYAAKKKVENQRAREAMKAAAAEWRAKNPEVGELLDEYAEEHHILDDMARKLSLYGSLTERQVEFIWKLAEETVERLWEQTNAEPEPEPEPIPAELDGERVELSGTVLGTKYVENDWGGATKMLFRDDRGFKLWGTAVGEKGERVSFWGKVQTSDDDPCFGFYSRPTKVQTLDQEEVAA